MSQDNGKYDQITKWVRLVARIWSVPLILYAGLMLIGYGWSWVTSGVADPYAVENYPLIESLPPILMFMGIVGLGIAWRWEGMGGAIDLFFQLIVILLLLFTRPFSQDFSYVAVPYGMTLAAAIPGILFLVYRLRSRGIPVP